MKMTPCVICGIPCVDHDSASPGGPFRSCCKQCSIEVHIASGNHVPQGLMDREDPAYGDGFPKGASGHWEPYIEQVKQHRKSVATIPIDKPCRQCQRNCTPGDAKCWWCQCVNPCEGVS